MATYSDPGSSPIPNPLDLGKRLFRPTWPEQWLSHTMAWLDPVADLGAGTVTALMPDVLLTVLSEGILSRFHGRQISATLLGHELTGTLTMLKVRRRGAHFHIDAALTGLRWDDHPIEELTLVCHGVRLVPGVPTKIRINRVEITGTATTAALVEWLGTREGDWLLTLSPDGLIHAGHRRRRVKALLDASITDNMLHLDVRRATWWGLPLPARMRAVEPTMLPDLPRGGIVRRAARDDERIRFEIEVPDISGSFDLAQIRSAIVAGTTLIVF
ncbi:hypothetical protein [Nocardia paucivorans]|uniref:hypothetical protein n=1 Tax=Nocardia paucivorans TaxID=114259 RepID=UPI00059347EC|nr:hypothetical protein [Nocardia paucivorans]